MLKRGFFTSIIILGFVIQPVFGQGSMELGDGKISDSTMSPGQILTAFYKINSQNVNPTFVGLGIKIFDDKSDVTYFDKENDVLVKTTRGINTYTRYFSIPSDARLGEYKVELSIWTGIPFESKNISNFTTELILVEGPSERQLLVDGFENYETGKFPQGNWRLAWDGIGDSCQKVVEDVQQSGNKALRLWARPSNATAPPALRDAYSAVAVYTFSSQSRFIGYEFSILLSDKKDTSEHDRMGFYNHKAEQDGGFWTRVDFRHDQDTILAEDKRIVFENWEPNKWIRVKALLDRQDNTFDMWINGEKSIGHKDKTLTELIDALALVADHTGLRVYFDDVRIFEYPDVQLENHEVSFPSTYEALKDKKANPDNLLCKFEQLQPSINPPNLGDTLNDYFGKYPFTGAVITVIIGGIISIWASWYFSKRKKEKT